MLGIENKLLQYFSYGDTLFIAFISITLLGFIFLIRESEYLHLTVKFLKFLYFLSIFIFLFQLSQTLFYHIKWQILSISLFNFIVVFISSFYIYKILFKNQESIFYRFKVENFFLSFGYISLFIFLNIEIYNLFQYLYNTNASNASLTFLWVIYGIVTIVIGLKRDINIAKRVGVALLFIAILKTFFVDLSNAQPIHKIILFIVVGLILFISSYYYNKLYHKREIK